MVPLFLGELGEPQGQEGPRALATKGPTEEVSPHRISTSHTTPFPGAKQRSWRAGHRAPVGRNPKLEHWRNSQGWRKGVGVDLSPRLR